MLGFWKLSSARKCRMMPWSQILQPRSAENWDLVNSSSFIHFKFKPLAFLYETLWYVKDNDCFVSDDLVCSSTGNNYALVIWNAAPNPPPPPAPPPLWPGKAGLKHIMLTLASCLKFTIVLKQPGQSLYFSACGCSGVFFSGISRFCLKIDSAQNEWNNLNGP